MMSEPPSSEDRTTITIHREWCKLCGICVVVCPKHVLVMRDGELVVERLEDCSACALCETHCPDFAICVNCGKRKLDEAEVAE